MKHEPKPIEINSEAALALVIHLKGLSNEYVRITKLCSGNDYGDSENRAALELIKQKMFNIEEVLNWVNEIY